MFRQPAENRRIEDRAQRFYGLEVGTRMTVIRPANGRLLLHSPVSLDPALCRELDAIGHVSFVVAPNRVHHRDAGDMAKAYSEEFAGAITNRRFTQAERRTMRRSSTRRGGASACVNRTP